MIEEDVKQARLEVLVNLEKALSDNIEEKNDTGTKTQSS